MRLGGAVLFLLCCAGGFEFGRDVGAFATGQAAAQLGPQFFDVVVKRDHRPLLLFRRRGGAHRADRAGSRTLAPRSGARGSRFCRALTIKCARLRAPYARQNWGQPRLGHASTVLFGERAAPPQSGGAFSAMAASYARSSFACSATSLFSSAWACARSRRDNSQTPRS